jgi:hypothetical protein
VSQSKFIGLADNHTANGLFCDGKPFHGACSACFDPAVQEFSSKGMGKAVQENLNSMRFGDYSTVLLAAFLVGISIGEEIQDIFHCRALRLSPLGQSQPGFHLGLKILELIRQFALLPVVVIVVPLLVMHRGADALSLCFNTLALLFLLDCDNMAFRGLSTTDRSQGSRLILTKAAAQLLNYSKKVHIMLVTGAIPLAVLEVQDPGLLAPTTRGTI